MAEAKTAVCCIVSGETSKKLMTRTIAEVDSEVIDLYVLFTLLEQSITCHLEQSQFVGLRLLLCTFGS